MVVAIQNEPMQKRIRIPNSDIVSTGHAKASIVRTKIQIMPVNHTRASSTLAKSKHKLYRARNRRTCGSRIGDAAEQVGIHQGVDLPGTKVH